MNRRNTYSKLIDELRMRNSAFAVWSAPGAPFPEVLIGGELLHLNGYPQLNGQEGFVFAPFRISEDSPLLLLRPEIRIRTPDEAAAFDPESLPVLPPCEKKEQNPYIIEKEDYLRDIQTAVQHIRRSGLSKVILSRLLSVASQDESAGQLYMQLEASTPNAFVYLVNLPEAGLWMGASPESLLESHGRQMETVSLAGTQPRRPDGGYAWYTKEIEEQAFVSRYLLDVFHRFGVHPYTTRGPETMESGRVAHLKTTFRFPARTVHRQLGNFIEALHPTPAVCGLPRDKADRYISRAERHDRRYYTGCLGPWQLDGQLHLFVNLRCMELLPGRYLLYAGGGITAHSVPGEEWTETGNKAQTLLSAIESLQHHDIR
ncbi:MAG: chorismate-binding protein [Mangrovibacterium sp.]